MKVCKLCGFITNTKEDEEKFFDKDSSICKKCGKKKYYIIYQKTRIRIPFNPRKGVCEVCGRSVKKGEIKTTQLHHWWYAYETETVKKNPLLALENTIEMCFRHHHIADYLRGLTTEVRPENVKEIIDTANKMPEWMRKRLTRICVEWLRNCGIRVMKK